MDGDFDIAELIHETVAFYPEALTFMIKSELIAKIAEQNPHLYQRDVLQAASCQALPARGK